MRNIVVLSAPLGARPGEMHGDTLRVLAFLRFHQSPAAAGLEVMGGGFTPPRPRGIFLSKMM